jgi:hypothetical protein
MCNGRLVLCVLAVLSVVAAGFLALAVPASAAPCPDKQGPAAAGKSCVSGGPPSKGPEEPATAPVAPASPGPVETQPIGSGADNVPAQDTAAGQETAPAPGTAAGTPSAQIAVVPPAETELPSRSARTLTAAPPDSGTPEAFSAPVAGYLVAIGGGMLLLSSVFGFLRVRPAAR